jgi:dTDP-L-rhamnose 4-epimerase
MGKRILITGGAGFIGSHLADELLEHGHRVRALDALAPQVHGDARRHPGYLDKDVEVLVGDVRDRERLDCALSGVDAVYHFAAAVGVGQSMYEVEHYTSINDVGTSVLMEALIKRPVEKLVVASSMSIYGEGLYSDGDGGVRQAPARSLEQLKLGDWELHDENGHVLEPVATPETKAPCLSSIYALSKYVQERMCLVIGRAYKIPTVALRFFNVYGPRQALSNPYTGVLAIFAARYLNDKPPLIFEDGLQRRDFVSVYDVARACRLCLDAPDVEDRVLNIGSGEAYTVRDIADAMARALNKSIEPEIVGKYRMGDIRHCFADIGLARAVLGYNPRVKLDEGIVELAEWLEGQAADDYVESASAELATRGLTL